MFLTLRTSDFNSTLKIIVNLKVNSKYFEIIEIPFKHAVRRNVYLLNVKIISKYIYDNASDTSKIRFVCFHCLDVQLILSHDVITDSVYKHLLRVYKIFK